MATPDSQITTKWTLPSSTPLDRFPCISRRLARHKAYTYDDRVTFAMQDGWFELKTRKFLDTFVPGANIGEAQLRVLGDFSALDLDYNKVDESLIYPALVCDFQSFSLTYFNLSISAANSIRC